MGSKVWSRKPVVSESLGQYIYTFASTIFFCFSVPFVAHLYEGNQCMIVYVNTPIPLKKESEHAMHL